MRNRVWVGYFGLVFVGLMAGLGVEAHYCAGQKAQSGEGESLTDLENIPEMSMAVLELLMTMAGEESRRGSAAVASVETSVE